jgi:Icc-related predicted phosphoesterase
LPEELVEIPHDGSLKILAFSDYKIHNLDMLLNFIESLSEEPDLIIYAGGGLLRFTRPSPELFYSKCLVFQSDYLPEYDYIRYGEVVELIWRIPKKLATDFSEEYLKQRLATVIELAKDVKQLIDRSRATDFLPSLKELISKKYAPFDVVPIDKGEFFEKYAIIDRHAGTEILSLHVSKNKIILNTLLSIISSLDEIDSLTIERVHKDKKYVCYRVVRARHKHNVLELLAKKSRFGLIVVAGDDDIRGDFYVYGEKVFNADKTWVKVGRFLVVGLEGVTVRGDIFADRYSEADTRLRLELAKDFAKNDTKLIIVSHAPPHGVLDRELRYGTINVGSVALRDFIEENSQKVPLVVCGHAESLGGRWEKLQDTVVVNVSNLDNVYYKANVALINLDENGHVDIRFYRLPSVVEEIFESNDKEDVLRKLKEKALLSDQEARLFINMFEKYGRRFLEDLHKLAELKFRYGFSWDNVFKLYMRGIISAEQISSKVIEDVLKETHGIHKVHLRRAFVKVVKEREKGSLYLLRQIPLEDKIMLIDTEYIPREGSTEPVLYGLLDVATGELKQFWFFEVDKLTEYLKSKADYLFTYWGGADKKIFEMLGFRVRFLNLLYQVQISLVAPIESTDLESVHDVLCGHKNEDWWQRYFYGMHGLVKLMLCNRILKNPDDLEAREALANANKADLLALKCVVDQLKRLKIKKDFREPL